MADTNHITSAARAAFQGNLNDLITDLDAAGGTLNIVSFFNNNVPRPGGPVYFNVTSAVIVDDVVDSMRRRKPGVGT